MHNLSTVEPGKEARLTVVRMPEEYVCVCVYSAYVVEHVCAHACMYAEGRSRARV